MLSTFGVVDNVTFSHTGPMARHVYSQVAIEHDKRNSQDSENILLNN